MKTHKNTWGRIFSTILYIFFLPSLMIAQESWFTASSNGFTPRFFHSSSVIEGKIYSVGGSTDPNKTKAATNTLEVYDPASNSWNTVNGSGNFARRYGATSESIEGKIYVIGGADSNAVISCTLDVFDIAKNEWSTPTTSGVFTPRYALSSVVFNGKIYVIGGGGSTVGNWGNVTEVLEVFDPATNQWSTPTTIGTFSPRRGAATVVFNNKIYLLGGFDGSKYTTKVDVFDPVTNQWTSPTISGKQIGRSGISASVIGGYIYIFGGNANNSFPVTVEQFDPVNNKITTVVTSGTFTARTGITSNVIGDKIYVIGGYDGNIVVGSNEVFSLQPNSVIANNELPKLYLTPNPSNTNVIIHGVPENIQHISIFNVLGESVVEIMNPQGGNTTIDMSNLLKGIYFVRLLSITSTSTLFFTRE
ncbi:MAG: T9SS type A sorting domain-containing protein [Ignavibacteria bacterium]|nr:T9SS type A sorting domain-containing protein [Ignavibacteria bacterium]